MWAGENKLIQFCPHTHSHLEVGGGGAYLTALFDGQFHSRLLGDARQCFDQANYTALAALELLVIIFEKG